MYNCFINIEVKGIGNISNNLLCCRLLKKCKIYDKILINVNSVNIDYFFIKIDYFF